MYFVYVLKSLTRKYCYVGITNSIDRRYKQHSEGKERTTAPYRPFSIVLTEKYLTRGEARLREKYLKSGIGKEWLKRVS